MNVSPQQNVVRWVREGGAAPASHMSSPVTSVGVRLEALGTMPRYYSAQLLSRVISEFVRRNFKRKELGKAENVDAILVPCSRLSETDWSRAPAVRTHDQHKPIVHHQSERTTNTMTLR